MTVIPFGPRKAHSEDRLPLLAIEIYPGPQNSFDWIVMTDEDTALSNEELSGYLGDMFIMLNPQPPGILERVKAFFANIFRKGDDK